MVLDAIFGCWTRVDIDGAEQERVESSLREVGFSRVKRYPGGAVRLKRGSRVGGFDLQSEGHEVQAVLESRPRGLRIHVGNWGFPGEVQMMRKRFERLAGRLQQDIAAHGALVPRDNEAREVAEQASGQRREAVIIGVVAAVVGGVVGWWL